MSPAYQLKNKFAIAQVKIFLVTCISGDKSIFCVKPTHSEHLAFCKYYWLYNCPNEIENMIKFFQNLHETSLVKLFQLMPKEKHWRKKQ